MSFSHNVEFQEVMVCCDKCQNKHELLHPASINNPDKWLRMLFDLGWYIHPLDVAYCPKCYDRKDYFKIGRQIKKEWEKRNPGWIYNSRTFKAYRKNWATKNSIPIVQHQECVYVQAN